MLLVKVSWFFQAVVTYGGAQHGTVCSGEEETEVLYSSCLLNNGCREPQSNSRELLVPALVSLGNGELDFLSN